ncbi:MAG: Leu/Phe/Val dehydrogenase [Blastocatellia bacterium]
MGKAMIIERLNVPTHQEVVCCRGEATGLQAIIAIHDTTFGPAVGGTRMWRYTTEAEALADALRLSAAMTYKAVAADLPFGGGKAVIIGNPERDKSEERLRAFGRFVESLEGRFLTGDDVGVSADDLRIVARETKYVVHPAKDPAKGMDSQWDTSYITALGVLHGIKAAAQQRFQTSSLSEVSVAIQGLGKVGGWLARLLHAEGARLSLTDLDHGRLLDIAGQLNARAVSPSEIYRVEADVFSPCALGGVLNDEVIPLLKCRVVAGAANNQLAQPRHAEELRKRGVLYAPDYVINAGGLISALYEMGRCDGETTLRRTAEIYDRLMSIFALARRSKISPASAADHLVEDKIRRAKKERSR